jgi:hypothetical protein
MSIATYYALDKVTGYFAKKYSEICRKFDNRLFMTEQINEGVKYEIKDLVRERETLFDAYIKTGKYGNKK